MGSPICSDSPFSARRRQPRGDCAILVSGDIMVPKHDALGSMPPERTEQRVSTSDDRRRAARAPVFGACLAAAAALACPDAQAAADCAASTIPVAFGAYDPLATAPLDSAGRVTVVCTYTAGGTSQVSFIASLSPGNSGTYTQRRLRDGTAFLLYNLYSDTARSLIWGDGRNGTTAASGSFTIGPGVGNRRREANFAVYGRIPAQQDVLPGNYSDSIIVTLTF